MKKQMVIDLLLAGVLMGAALCVTRGFLQSSIAAFFGAWLLALAGMLIALESRRMRRAPQAPIDTTTRPRSADFQ